MSHSHVKTQSGFRDTLGMFRARSLRDFGYLLNQLCGSSDTEYRKNRAVSGYASSHPMVVGWSNSGSERITLA